MLATHSVWLAFGWFLVQLAQNKNGHIGEYKAFNVAIWSWPWPWKFIVYRLLERNSVKFQSKYGTKVFSCLSVRPSVTPFSLCSHHRIIMKFSGVNTNDKGDVHAKGQGQRSKVKVTKVKTQFSCFRTVTPVRIHIWRWNDEQCLMLLRRGALLFFKVIRQISRSHG